MKKPYHHGDLKQAALLKALEMIEERGEVSFTLRELAKAAQVSHTALYRHYSSKRMLIIDIAEDGFKTLNRGLENILSSRGTAKARLVAFGIEYVVFAFQRKGHYRAMYHRELRCGSDLPESMTREAEKAFHHLMTLVAAALPEGRKKKTSPELAAQSMWASLHGFASLLIDGQLPGLSKDSEIRKAAKAHVQLLIA